MAREQKTESVINRRSYLKLAATTVGTAALMGTTGAATRVNIVDAGADDSGQQSVNDVLQDIYGDETEVYFPVGTYLLNPIQLSGSGWSLVGDGPGETIIKVPNWVHAGSHNYLSLNGNNWEMAGFTIDLTEPDAAPVNLLRGTDWAFRNIEMKGRMGDPQTRSGSNLFYPAVTTSGATGLMENVIMKDGSAPPDGSSNRGGMWFGSNNEGHMILRGLHMESFANNTLYAAASAGPVTIEDCVFKNTNVGVRIGGNTVVRNCVWLQDGQVPAQRWTGGRSARGLWINSNKYVPGDILIEGCHFTMTGGAATGAIRAKHGADGIEVRNTRIEQGNSRSAVDLPSGATSPTFEGVSLTGISSAPAVRLVDCDGATFRNVCVQQPGTGIDLNSSDGCHVEESTINSGGQAIVLNGSNLATRNFSQAGTCPVPSQSPTSSDSSDDTSTDDDSSGDNTTTDETSETESLSSLISIDGRNVSGPVHYRLTVSGDIRKSNVGESTINPDDVISGSTAKGFVDGGSDSYEFSGEIDALVLEKAVTIWQDGSRLDSSAYTVDASAFDSSVGNDSTNVQFRELVIEGGSRRHWTYYDFTVDGALEKEEVDGATINPGDTIADGVADGFVASGTDAYRFSGEITEFNLDGQADVYVDGEQIEISTLPSSQLPNTIIVDGSVAAGGSRYTIEVDGKIEKSRSLGTVTAEDEINGSIVTGYVGDGKDGYRFSGDVTSFDLEGTGAISFEDNDG